MNAKSMVFATNNAHKLQEVRQIVGGAVGIVSLDEAGCTGDIPETGDTLEENALQKARSVYAKCGCDCFADDTGLEVEALGGRPGVRSARYAGGRGHDSEANMAKLLSEMDGVENRKARFRTVIALIQDGKEYLFEGVVNGEIATERHGVGGFGYDPVFIPCGSGKSFAEMGSEEKNAISHRGRAALKLTQFLNDGKP